MSQQSGYAQAVCVLTFQAFKLGDVHLDHATPVQIIKERIQKLVVWLNAAHNKALAAEVIKLESAKQVQYFLKDGDKIFATAYFVNRYFNDVDNITVMSPHSNLSKSKKEFYTVLARHDIFKKGFVQQVERANRRQRNGSCKATDFIVEKAGGTLAYYILDENKNRVYLSRGEQGLGKYTREWLRKTHPGLLDVPRMWNSVMKKMLAHYSEPWSTANIRPMIYRCSL